jgi:hypothetical protein
VREPNRTPPPWRLAERRTVEAPRYRRYPVCVEDEVCVALADPARQFERGPRVLLARGTAIDDRAAFVVVDRNYVSGRWLGDAYLFARTFDRLLREAPAPSGLHQ